MFGGFNGGSGADGPRAHYNRQDTSDGLLRHRHDLWVLVTVLHIYTFAVCIRIFFLQVAWAERWEIMRCE